MNCPECGNYVKSKKCSCGWTSPSASLQTDDPYHGCCEWISSAGRCHFGGSMSNTNKWYCKGHYQLKSPAMGDQIVAESHRLIPSPDYLLEARRKISMVARATKEAEWLAKKAAA